jgi:hypothetical protein
MENQYNLEAYKDFEIHLKEITLSRSEADADEARKILLKESEIIKDMINKGRVSQRRLDILAKDQAHQNMYSFIMRGYMEGENEEKAKETFDNLHDDDYVGFLVYSRNYLEEKFGVKLVSEED